MNFETGDFVAHNGEGWIITSIDNEDGICDLINKYKEEKWNVDLKRVTLLVKFNQLK